MLLNSKVQEKGLKYYIKFGLCSFILLQSRTASFTGESGAPFHLGSLHVIVCQLYLYCNQDRIYQGQFNSVQLLPSTGQPHSPLLASWYIPVTLKSSKVRRHGLSYKSGRDAKKKKKFNCRMSWCPGSLEMIRQEYSW